MVLVVEFALFVLGDVAGQVLVDEVTSLAV